MARLRLASIVGASVEEVYSHVTSYGPDGPSDDDQFREEYGEIVDREGDALYVREDVRRYPEDDPELITWRCLFDFPKSRSMEAVDSVWANRYDRFEPEGDGTRWTVVWDTRVGGLKGIVQWLVFRLFTHKGMRGTSSTRPKTTSRAGPRSSSCAASRPVVA